MIFILLFFILPIVVAFVRGHNNAIPITIINIFLGATVVGYFVCLAWSFNDNTDPKKGFKQIKDWHLLIACVIVLGALVGWYKFVFLKHHKPTESKGLLHIIVTDIVRDVIQEEVGGTIKKVVPPINKIF